MLGVSEGFRSEFSLSHEEASEPIDDDPAGLDGSLLLREQRWRASEKNEGTVWPFKHEPTFFQFKLAGEESKSGAQMSPYRARDLGVVASFAGLEKCTLFRKLLGGHPVVLKTLRWPPVTIK